MMRLSRPLSLRQDSNSNPRKRSNTFVNATPFLTSRRATSNTSNYTHSFKKANHTPATNNLVGNGFRSIFVVILVALIILLSLILVVLLFPSISRRIRQKIINSKGRIKKRYHTVDAWMITKPIVYTKKAFKPNSLDSFPLNHLDQIQFSEEEGNTGHIDDELPLTLVPHESENLNCSICMESFGPTDLISWSPRFLGCYHAFHKDCIREWLLRHRECPCCRQIMLPVDVEDNTLCRRVHITHSTLRLWTKERNRRYHETVYCASKGVIDIDIDTLSHFEGSSSMDQLLSNHSETCLTSDPIETQGMKNVNGIFDLAHTYESPIPGSKADTIDSPDTHASFNIPVYLQ